MLEPELAPEPLADRELERELPAPERRRVDDADLPRVRLGALLAPELREAPDARGFDLEEPAEGELFALAALAPPEPPLPLPLLLACDAARVEPDLDELFADLDELFGRCAPSPLGAVVAISSYLPRPV